MWRTTRWGWWRRRGGGRACRFGPADRGVGGVPDAGDRAAGPQYGRDGWPAGRRRPGRAHAPASRRRDRGAAAQLQHHGRLAPGQPRRAWTAGRRAGRVAAGGHAGRPWGASGRGFAALAQEAGRLLGADAAHVLRYEHDATVTLVAGWSRDGQALPVGTRTPIEEETLSALMLRTGQPARTDSHADHPGAIGTRIRQLGIRSSVACPITVQGRLWGATAVSSTQPQPLPPDTQARIADFTELPATQASLPVQLGELHAQLDRVADGLSQALEELRETSRGIHPAALSQGGLGPALKVLARRCPLPVQADLKLQTRLPEPVEVAAYYVVAEALTNAAKHAHASLAHLAVQAHRDRLHLSVADDGVGGADPTRGSGLVGLSDRVQALGGTITVHSPTGQGTTLQIALPIDLKGD